MSISTSPWCLCTIMTPANLKEWVWLACFLLEVKYMYHLWLHSIQTALFGVTNHTCVSKNIVEIQQSNKWTTSEMLTCCSKRFSGTHQWWWWYEQILSQHFWIVSEFHSCKLDFFVLIYLDFWDRKWKMMRNYHPTNCSLFSQGKNLKKKDGPWGNTSQDGGDKCYPLEV